MAQETAQEPPARHAPRSNKVMEKMPPEFYREYLDMDTDEEEFGHQETPEPQDEAPPEPEKPNFSAEEIQKLLDHAKSLTVLPNLTDTSWTESCLQVVRDYFCDPTKVVLAIFFCNGKLQALLDFPAATDSGMTYFLREPWQVYNAENFMDSVVFGSVDARAENTIMKFVDGVYAPVAFKHPDWPEIMKDDIFLNLNDFLTQAFEVTYKPLGILILYTPWEGIRPKPKESNLELSNALRTKAQREQALLIGRLERVARTWVKQIREAIKSRPVLLTDQLHGVGCEFEFWQNRYENLASISKQLANYRLLLILRQLKRVKSSSISDIRQLVGKVQVALDEAKSNLVYLDALIECCSDFTDPSQIYDCLPRIVHVLRFLKAESVYYAENENIERLFRALSINVVEICISNIDVKLIFEDPKKCRESLKVNLWCCDAYLKIYESMVENSNSSENCLGVRKVSVFKCINAFEQRCRDVADICDAIMIYANKISLGGTKGNQHEMQYRRVKDYFVQIVDEMRICCEYALDITRDKWFQDMSNFLIDVAELENTVKNLLNSLFEDVESVEMGIETLFTLLNFKERRGFDEIVKYRWSQVWEMFYEEIKLCSLESEESCEIAADKARYSESEKAVMSDIYINYLGRLHKMMINASDWLGDSELQFELPAKFAPKKR